VNAAPTIQPVRDARGIAMVARLADEIWREHYPPIIGTSQVNYMLERFQSEEAIAAQMAAGCRYFLIVHRARPVGYVACEPESEAGRLFLSKLYVRRDERRRGLARAALGFLEALCRREGLGRIALTVNRHNAGSIRTYEQLGFHRAGTQVKDIGGGFAMDDYVMEKEVPGGTETG
jgi:GNAT superfamily N-acetyltransferase